MTQHADDAANWREIEADERCAEATQYLREPTPGPADDLFQRVLLGPEQLVLPMRGLRL